MLEYASPSAAVLVGVPIGTIVSIGCTFDVVHAFQLKAWDRKERKKNRGNNSSK
jgi:hypothetical protein